jgi:hypothetical protein
VDEISSNQINKIFSNVFRKNHDKKGFAVVSFDRKMNSGLLREYMLKLKRELAKKCEEKFKKSLDYYWMGRFDQQTTTKYHRDNAPSDSYLMLGYEPTVINSKLFVADYHQLIAKENIPIDSYYEKYNPIFKKGEEHLAPYITEIESLKKETYHIVLLNNSDLHSPKTYGVLHKAEMINTDPAESRIVNSIMLYLKPFNQPSKIATKEVSKFLESHEVSEY